MYLVFFYSFQKQQKEIAHLQVFIKMDEHVFTKKMKLFYQYCITKTDPTQQDKNVLLEYIQCTSRLARSAYRCISLSNIPPSELKCMAVFE